MCFLFFGKVTINTWFFWVSIFAKTPARFPKVIEPIGKDLYGTVPHPGNIDTSMSGKKAFISEATISASRSVGTTTNKFSHPLENILLFFDFWGCWGCGFTTTTKN